MTALFEDVIFGPIRSRRLGLSLGVNLLPERAKICNFDCIYCECGDNSERRGEASQRRFADIERVKTALRQRLEMQRQKCEIPDVITFAGNGEPTLHPHFEDIIDYTLSLRDELAPAAKVSVLSNATMLDNDSVVRALNRVDNNILKLDSAFTSTVLAINRPVGQYSVEGVVNGMLRFKGRCIVQTMFLSGEVAGVHIDNTIEEEVLAWLELIKQIMPQSVMIYSIDRDTPCENLNKVPREILLQIAVRVEALGVSCSVA